MKLIFGLVAVVAIFCSCNSSVPNKTSVAKKHDSSLVKTESRNDSLEEKQRIKDYEDSLLVPKSTNIQGYSFRYGYTKYNEDKYGFENPGFLEVYKNGKLIFKDTIQAYAEINIESLGNKFLSGRKFIFKLNYGTEACDYPQISRYYFISPADTVRFIKQYTSSGNEYGGVSFKSIFSKKDTNRFIVVELMQYNEKGHKDISDTSLIDFSGNQFTVKKLSDNIEKANKN